MNVAISAIMESNQAAESLRKYLASKGISAGICDGARVVAEDTSGAATLIAAHFHDFLNGR